MNLFEDLIEELRDENLLEETITASRAAGANGTHSELAPSKPTHRISATEDGEDDSASAEASRIFYHRRAMDEVSCLQMVEHILSGIEREYMKIVPATFDDLKVKKALHIFLQVDGDTSSKEYAEAEFNLLHETEAWSLALSKRDTHIPVSGLRRFCENSRPALSSQALLALARFYRNASYAENSRAKFDFVMTRLFSRETEGEKRRLLFSRSEMIGHIKTLYANWASAALYSADDATLKTRAIVAGFEDRTAEAESALTFDQLIQDDFFKKVHEFKVATGEVFFTPEVVSVAIDCNTRIGNKFIDLLRLERERTSPESVERKYGYEYDQIISDAAGKTLHLVELANTLEGDLELGNESGNLGASKIKTFERAPTNESGRLFTSDMFRVNKWLLAFTILVVLASAVAYFWSSQPSTGESANASATSITLDDVELKEYLRSGRGTAETFYAITLPAWDLLEDDKKKEVLQQALDLAKKNGLKKVQLISVNGRTAAIASENKLEIQNATR